jgi:hypothetical protein
MTLLYTDTPRFSKVVKQELWAEAGYTRAVITLNGPAATLLIGTVLGKVTATGKYKVAIETAVDGSKVADAIVIRETAVLNATDTKVLVLIKGPAIVSKTGLILDASYNDDTKKGVVYASLEAKNINVDEAA